MFLCCGWQTKEFSSRVSLRRMLFLSAKAGMSQKILPSANNASSLFVSPFSKSFLSLFLFLNLFLASASSYRNFSCSVCGDRRLTGAAFPVFESHATNMKLAVRTTESAAPESSARKQSYQATHGHLKANKS